MSKVFYDEHIDLSGVEREVKKVVKDPDARAEIFALIDEIVHHRVVGCVLDRLPKSSHPEFVDHVSDHPHDASIMHFLKERIGEDIGHFLRQEVHKLSGELLHLVHETTGDTKEIEK